MPELIVKVKFSPGETVWFMKDNKAYDGTVIRVDASIHKAATRLKYNVNTIVDLMTEEQLYASKEALLKSL